MTLDLRYVARCDRCTVAVYLETRDLTAAQVAYREAGWRLVVEDKGRELLCADCLSKLRPAHRDAVIERGVHHRPSVTLARPRYRPGVFPCGHCGDLISFADAVVRMGKAERMGNLYCAPCAIADARRQGYVAVIPELHRKGASKPAPAAQASLIE